MSFVVKCTFVRVSEWGIGPPQLTQCVNSVILSINDGR